MRYVIFVLCLTILLITACGDGSSPQMSSHMQKVLGSNMTYSETLQPQSRCDTLVVKIEALNIEVLETCFNLNYVPVKLKTNE